jgi:beta-lactamase class A
MDRLIFFKRTSLILLIFFVLTNVLFLWWITNLYQEKGALTNEYNTRLEEFELLSPEIAWLDVDSFLAKQNDYSLQYYPLKSKLIEELNKSPNGNYGIYFQDLNTGASIGINEKDKFVPQSLFKVPLMVAVLKKVQDGNLLLNTTIYLSKEDLDSESGDLFQKGMGYPLTVKELLEIMIQKSDNTAMRTLSNRFVNDANYLEVTSIMGLPPPDGGIITVSPKEYSNIFRSLYYSNYLRRPFSELALSIMTETEFKEQLSAGIPENIKISHKFGSNDNLKYYHDCGIIYLEKKNYILCVMSKGNTKEEANLMISNISKIVYGYVSEKK